MTLRDLILRDFWLKLFSLLLASMVWVTVHILILRDSGPIANPLGREIGSREISGIPIRVVQTAADPRKWSVMPREVDLSVSGNPDLIALLGKEDLIVSVDLRESRSPVPFNLKLRVDAPQGVTVSRLLPEQVRVEPAR